MTTILLLPRRLSAIVERIMEGIKLFGSAARTRVVTAAVALRDSYPREISRVAGVPLLSTQRILADLEREGILASRLAGNQRQVRVNPDWPAASELRALALRTLDLMPDLRTALEGQRRRPRRSGKPLDRT